MAAERPKQAFGQVDILVNNAGCNVRKPALEVTWDDWNLILDTNLRGAFFVAQAVARGMIQRGYGRIINIGSVTSVAGYAGLAPYGASRGGIRQLTMSLADDWGKHGVTVNCLAPGWFRTAQNKVLYQDQEWVAISRTASRSNAPGKLAIWTGRWSFWPLNRAATSPVRPCWSMAEFRPAPYALCPGRSRPKPGSEFGCGRIATGSLASAIATLCGSSVFSIFLLPSLAASIRGGGTFPGAPRGPQIVCQVAQGKAIIRGESRATPSDHEYQGSGGTGSPVDSHGFARHQPKRIGPAENRGESMAGDP